MTRTRTTDCRRARCSDSVYGDLRQFADARLADVATLVRPQREPNVRFGVLGHFGERSSKASDIVCKVELRLGKLISA